MTCADLIVEDKPPLTLEEQIFYGLVVIAVILALVLLLKVIS